MNFDTFFENIAQSGTKIRVDSSSYNKPNLLNNEALFQLPLISLIVLLMAKDKRKPKVSEIGQLVGESLETSMPGFKGSAQHVGWSANLRVRTVKAVSFLEYSKLIEIPNNKGRIKITNLGKKVIDKAFNEEDILACNLGKLRLRSRKTLNLSLSNKKAQDSTCFDAFHH